MIQSIIIDPSLLHLLWQVVAEFNYQELVLMSDRELAKIVRQQVEKQVLLGAEEARNLEDYVSSKFLLIRDLADNLLCA